MRSNTEVAAEREPACCHFFVNALSSRATRASTSAGMRCAVDVDDIRQAAGASGVWMRREQIAGTESRRAPNVDLKQRFKAAPSKTKMQLVKTMRCQRARGGK